MNDTARTRTAPKYQLFQQHYKNKTELVHALDQLIDQHKQFTVTAVDEGWLISYTTGPSRT